MKKALPVVVVISFFAFIVLAAPVKDWHKIDQVHQHLTEAIHEMEAAAKANSYDMAGHAKKAEQMMRDAEKELAQAVEAAKQNH
jgi:F0F1-type ATP synthase membrane subunit b/b'